MVSFAELLNGFYFDSTWTVLVIQKPRSSFCHFEPPVWPLLCLLLLSWLVDRWKDDLFQFIGSCPVVLPADKIQSFVVGVSGNTKPTVQNLLLFRRQSGEPDGRCERSHQEVIPDVFFLPH